MASSTSLVPLTTIFVPPPFCAHRYVVFIGGPTPLGGIPSTNTPTSGWIDPSFKTCNPPQYTDTYPTFSPGVCPAGMSIVASSLNVDASKAVWAGACCESGFSQLDARYLCTSSVTTPMAFLLDPNVSTTDIYTTMSNVVVEHDQLTVLWEKSDLQTFPSEVAFQYASMMGIVATELNSGAQLSSEVSAQLPGTSIMTPPSWHPSLLESIEGELASSKICTSAADTTPASAQISGVGEATSCAAPHASTRIAAIVPKWALVLLTVILISS